MWLYLPSTSSASAPAAAGLISASSWHCRALAQSAWWRGKPSPPRIWWQRCERAAWLKQLCGAMPEPSMAGLGAASWMASLAASRASRTASQAASAAPSTSVTSGAPRGASSSPPGHGSSLSKTSPACSRRGMTKSLAPNGFGETYRSWVLRLRADCSARRKSAPATSASGFLSSVWPTPAAGLPNDGEEISTFAERQARQKAKGINGNGMGMPLAIAAKIWPTPTNRDYRSPNAEPFAERGGGQQGRAAAELRGASLGDTDNGPSQIGKGDASVRIWGAEQSAGHRAASRTALDVAASARGRPVAGEQGQGGGDADRPGLFPPGPADRSGWADVLERAPDLEPAVRRMVDGVAARLDLSGPHAARVDRLRLLGNGVVPLAAAHAVRTLLARLAARGVARAAELSGVSA